MPTDKGRISGGPNEVCHSFKAADDKCRELTEKLSPASNNQGGYVVLESVGGYSIPKPGVDAVEIVDE